MEAVYREPKLTDIQDQLLKEFRESIFSLVPSFWENMPEAYFNDMDEATILSHLKAIVANEGNGKEQELILLSTDGRTYTCINDKNYRGQLSQLVSRLPKHTSLNSAKVYSAKQSELIIDVFELGEQLPYNSEDRAQFQHAQRLAEYTKLHHPEIEVAELYSHINKCHSQYISSVTPHAFLRNLNIHKWIRETENSWVSWEQHDEQQMRLHLGFQGTQRRLMFEHVTRYLGFQGLDIERAYVDSFADITLISVLVGIPADISEEKWAKMRNDLIRFNHLDEKVFQCYYQLKGWSIGDSELLVALTHLSHQALTRLNPLVFTRHRILETATRYADVSHKIIKAFLQRMQAEGEVNPEFTELEKAISKAAQDVYEEKILGTLLQAVTHCLKTNFYKPQRYALAMRMDPAFIPVKENSELPFGIFYILGKQFDGFHVRFRDIARGGVRIVIPRTPAQYTRESDRLYDEAYALAAAQQLKNKDIPEGGSKGVILIRPNATAYRCGQAYADALLDLITPDPETRKYIRDYWGQEETLYLGPDENISNDLINWIVDRAQKRHYSIPNAFMSSKPGAGINHKEYGVTSEGVIVYLDTALRVMGINPNEQDFTIKITGGPDGDVAGNAIKILYREYGERARILGIADGSGSLEDPEGLHFPELLRLVEAELPVSAFGREYLSAEGRLLTVDEPEGLVARNTLHNRLITDAFIPAGGRPNTIHAENWEQFLKEDGKPSSNLIVEGANLFLTPDARSKLSDKGVWIIKDSSANKCGVICSSYEIIGSILLAERQFLEVKETYVSEVMVILRQLAQQEAETLMREHRHKPDIYLPELSMRLSRAIIRANDAIVSFLEQLEGEDMELARQWVIQHLPPTLRNMEIKEIFDKIPQAYWKQIIATSLSSRILYREGMDYFERMDEQAIAELAVKYMKQEKETLQLVEEVLASEMADKDRIAFLLMEGGTGIALRNPGR